MKFFLEKINPLVGGFFHDFCVFGDLRNFSMGFWEFLGSLARIFGWVRGGSFHELFGWFCYEPRGRDGDF